MRFSGSIVESRTLLPRFAVLARGGFHRRCWLPAARPLRRLAFGGRRRASRQRQDFADEREFSSSRGLQASSFSWRRSSASISAMRSSWRAEIAVADRALPLVVQRGIATSASAIAAGVALWLIATRAQAVSSRLTALSGNCRPGCSGGQVDGRDDGGVGNADAVMLFHRRENAAQHGARSARRARRSGWTGSGGSGQGPSRNTGAIRPRWSPPSCAGSRAPAPA